MEGGENHFTRFTNCTFLVLLQGVSWAVVIWMDVMMELCGGGMFYLYYSVHFYVTINYELGICGTEACSNDCHSIIFKLRLGASRTRSVGRSVGWSVGLSVLLGY